MRFNVSSWTRDSISGIKNVRISFHIVIKFIGGLSSKCDNRPYLFMFCIESYARGANVVTIISHAILIYLILRERERKRKKVQVRITANHFLCHWIENSVYFVTIMRLQNAKCLLTSNNFERGGVPVPSYSHIHLVECTLKTVKYSFSGQ